MKIETVLRFLKKHNFPAAITAWDNLALEAFHTNLELSFRIIPVTSPGKPLNPHVSCPDLVSKASLDSDQ